MKIKPITLSVALLLAGSHTAYASTPESENLKVRHHHLPPHLTAVHQGVFEQQQLQSVPLVQQSELKQEHSLQSLAQRQSTNSAASCNVTASALAAASVSARISMLKSSTDFKCLSDDLWKASNSLYQALFNQGVMLQIANEARTLAQSYDGTNSNHLQNFILYLRVGFWAQWGNKQTIGEYTQALTDANHSFLDAFAANANFYNTDEVHAKTAKEAMILMSNYSSHRYLPQAKRIIQTYDKSRDFYMQSMMTQALTLLYRGSWNTEYKAIVEADRSIINVLDTFLDNNSDLLGHKNEFQYTDAVNELGRFLGYGGETYKAAKPLVKKILDRYSLTGPGAGAWLKAAAQVDYADKANCSYYGTCNFKAQVEQQVLPITHSCSASLRVRAQDLTQAQLGQICSDLAAQEVYFHQKLETGNTPIADDRNTTLEIVIYNSSKDYKTYSGVLFGHSTNNGGIYLEGDPSKVGNIPRFLAYEAEWVRPAFQVWNLEHEYVHYLDGRFNLHGDFATGNAHDTVWWSEGLAEYVSKKDKNDKAVAKAKDKTYTLSTLFRTNYSKSSSQIYDWGYLATRYMFERQKGNVDNILSKFRVGDYKAYDGLLDGYGTSFNSDFSSWLDNVSSDGGTDPTNPTDPQVTELNSGDSRTLNASKGQQQKFVLDIPAGSSQLKIETSGGTGEGDLYVKVGSIPTTSDYDYRPWIAGNNEKVEVANPQAGKWYVMVNPDQDIQNVKLEVSWAEAPLADACNSEGAVNYGAIESGNPTCVSASSASFYIWVPAGSKKLSIATAHGQGDASLYHKAKSWPTTSSYDNASVTAGSNQEKIVLNNPVSAWHHIMLKNQGQGMTLKVDVK